MSTYTIPTPEPVILLNERLNTFYRVLADQYRHLFTNDSDYQYAAHNTTPEELARRMTLGLDRGSASKEGAGVRNTCNLLGIAYTYKSIRTYLQSTKPR
jgi:hypothetical protein